MVAALVVSLIYKHGGDSFAAAVEFGEFFGYLRDIVHDIRFRLDIEADGRRTVPQLVGKFKCFFLFVVNDIAHLSTSCLSEIICGVSVIFALFALYDSTECFCKGTEDIGGIFIAAFCFESAFAEREDRTVIGEHIIFPILRVMPVFGLVMPGKVNFSAPSTARSSSAVIGASSLKILTVYAMISSP